MYWARAGPGALRLSRASALNSRRAPGRPPSPSMRLAEQDTRAADLLWRDDAQEVGQHAVHQLEVGGERRGLLLLAVQHLFGESLLVQHLAAAPVDEVEVGGEAEALALQVAVATHQARAVVGAAHHALLRLEAGAVLLLETDPAADDERVLELLAHPAPERGVLQHPVRFQPVLLLLLLGVLAALAQVLQHLLERVVQRRVVGLQ